MCSGVCGQRPAHTKLIRECTVSSLLKTYKKTLKSKKSPDEEVRMQEITIDLKESV